MTQSTYSVESRASLDVRAVTLPRAIWETGHTPDGKPTFLPIKGTWYGHKVRGRAAHDVVIVPMLGCPSCGGLVYLAPTDQAAKLLGLRRAVHNVDHLGKVSPDIQCAHGRCDFHRTVYLDKWNKNKPLFCLAYTEGASSTIKFAYSHSVDSREARFHLGAGRFNIIAGGPAVGFHLNERTGRLSAD